MPVVQCCPAVHDGEPDADLDARTVEALDRSRYLVVLCSPRAVKSAYVAREIQHFKATGKADRVIADSRSQCKLRGEISRALQAGALAEEAVGELGAVIAGRDPGRPNDDEITVADLTGVAVQDLQIASAVFEAWRVERRG